MNPTRDWPQIERLFQAARFLHNALTPSATQRKKRYPEHTPMGKYMELLSTATQFIHFSSFGIDPMFVGFLKALSYRRGVSVRGIVTNPDPACVEMLTSVADAPDFEAHVFVSERGRPEQQRELVVVDGLAAIDGASMLDPVSWRHLLRDRRTLSVVTNAEEIVELNNASFAPFFGASSLVEGWNVFEARRQMVGRTWSWPG